MSDDNVGTPENPSGSTEGDRNLRGRRPDVAPQDDLDREFSSLVDTGDRDALAAFIGQHSAQVSLGPRRTRVRVWLEHFSEHEISESLPLLVAYGTLLAREGDVGGALIWLDRAVRDGGDLPLGDGRTVRSAVSAIKFAMGAAPYEPLEHSGVLAGIARDMWTGWRALIAEDFDDAESMFAALEQRTTEYPVLEVIRLTSLATVADALGQSDQALRWIDRTQVIISAYRWETDVSSFHFDALAARLWLDSGDRSRAVALAELCAPKLVALSLASQLRISLALLELADVYCRLNRPDASKGYLAQARLRLSEMPHMPYGQRRLQAVTSMIVEAGLLVDEPYVYSALLTQSETRVLRYLATHLSLPQIANELFVAPSTVRTHVQSIYRKLQVTDRRDAVSKAQSLGLLRSDD